VENLPFYTLGYRTNYTLLEASNGFLNCQDFATIREQSRSTQNNRNQLLR